MSVEEINLFSYSMPKFKIDKPVRLIELFAGIGAQSKALERLGIEFEHYYVCEIDKYALKSYNAIHGTNFQTRDITKVHANELKIVERDLFTYLDEYVRVLKRINVFIWCSKKTNPNHNELFYRKRV